MSHNLHTPPLELLTSRINTLIADDSVTQVRLVEKCLLHLGFREDHLITATSPETALEHIGKKMADLVILDLHFPERQYAIHLIEEVRRQYGALATILVISAHSEMDEVQEAFAAGADDYLLKPITVPKLKERLIPLLEKRLFSGPVNKCSEEIDEAELALAQRLHHQLFEPVFLPKAALWLGFLSPDEIINIFKMFDCKSEEEFLDRCLMLDFLDQSQVNTLKKLQLNMCLDLGDILQSMGTMTKAVYEQIQANEKEPPSYAQLPPEEHSTKIEDESKIWLEALNKGELEPISLLLRNGSFVDQPLDHGKTALWIALERDHLDMVRLLLKHRADPNQKRGDKIGWLPLMLAMRMNNPTCFISSKSN